MKKDESSRTWVENAIGKKAAASLFRKIKKMAKEGSTPEEIDRAITDAFLPHLRNEVLYGTPIVPSVYVPKKPRGPR